MELFAAVEPSNSCDLLNDGLLLIIQILSYQLLSWCFMNKFSLSYWRIFYDSEKFISNLYRFTRNASKSNKNVNLRKEFTIVAPKKTWIMSLWIILQCRSRVNNLINYIAISFSENIFTQIDPTSLHTTQNSHSTFSWRILISTSNELLINRKTWMNDLELSPIITTPRRTHKQTHVTCSPNCLSCFLLLAISTKNFQGEFVGGRK